MGTWCNFKCRNCGYSRSLSGGRDRGFDVEVETRRCLDCNELSDVIIGATPDMGAGIADEIAPKIGRCAYCKGKNTVPWKAPWVCPRCGRQMQVTACDTLWD